MHLVTLLVLAASLLAPGLYKSASGADIYAGIEVSQPDPAANETFNANNHHFDDAHDLRGLTLVRGINEKKLIVNAPQGKIGVSVYSSDGKKRAAVILVHGADPETREMGFLIPYFVANGINVISYDQRGTGESPGNWQLSGPAQRAEDVDAIFDAVQGEPRIDGKHIGVWGFSNGGWTAPLVATQRPFAFVLLKSAPAENVTANLLYEVRESMHRGGRSADEIDAALATWNALIDAINGTGSWQTVTPMYASAKERPWFDDSILSAVPFPMSKPVANGFRSYISFDPAATLRTLKAPTLAMYGANDRKVDVAHDAPTMRADVQGVAGDGDFTEIVYPQAMHPLKVSKDGFRPEKPQRLVSGYPEVMISWLNKRGFLTPVQP